ncbi:MAG: nucleotidyltransferase domain-containing protein [Alphaproteobacteria bacterium]|nr:nucleotidyltransferase domain-containing protein [Alphaproteobacteria bacterium]
MNNKTSNYSVMLGDEVKRFFYPSISQWANDYLNEFFIAGSSAKGVAIKGKSDVDLFVSIKSSCTVSLKDIYISLFNKLNELGKEQDFSVHQQNVSIGIKGLKYENRQIDIDIVPAKQQEINSNFHSLYKSKQNTWTQTNVKGHIKHIQDSGRQNFIKLIKIWRDCHQLDFPSMNIELSVLKALYGCNHDMDLEKGFVKIMDYFIGSFSIDNLIDPFNSANVISNDMTQYEKQKVIKQAQKFFDAKDWKEVIW